MYYVRELCHQRGASVDFDYWRKITKSVLKGIADRKPLVCPARAGSGKSTWITAFLLAACELRLNNDPLASVFSVLLVLQKIESLNSIRDTIAAFFPGAPETLVVPLQGWTTASQQAGFCKNAQVISFDQCRRDKCSYAASCDVLHFGQLAGQAFVLGVSQARFDLLRKGNALDGLLQQAENAHPRILIFDEKFEFAPLYHLTQTTLDAASSQLERLITQRDLKDRRVFEKQRWTTTLLRRPFSLLRERTCIARAKATAKQYDGNPTVYARFVAWLSGWDRVPTPLSSILHDTDIGAESWKKLRKSERFAPLLAQYGAEMTGRGRNVKIEEKSQKCA